MQPPTSVVTPPETPPTPPTVTGEQISTTPVGAPSPAPAGTPPSITKTQPNQPPTGKTPSPGQPPSKIKPSNISELAEKFPKKQKQSRFGLGWSGWWSE
ncbi:MAG TPA: hypothetical protein VGW78_02145 [Candidatus Babeliales bacterium]|nr:hypothetical protein [Candidatus Babeliales bacterium]